MNRAMGFGIATSTMMATTFVATSTASAHERTLSDSYGSVTVTSDHRAVKVIDHSCYDVLDVAAQYKYQAGGTVYTGGTGAGAHTCGDTIVHPTPGPIVSFRKCLRDGGTVSESDCGDWFSP